MVKGKRSSKKNVKQDQEVIRDVDLEKSIAENLQTKVKYWNELSEQIKSHQNEIRRLQEEFEGLPDIPKNRIRKADLRVKIEKYEQKIQRLKRSDNQVEYLSCVAKVYSEETKPEKDIFRGTAAAVEPHYVVSSGTYRQRQRIKPLADQKPLSARDDVCKVTPIRNFIPYKENENIKHTRKLSELMHESPTDSTDYHMCPICPGVIMEFVDNPPCRTCKLCGLSREVLDVSSVAAHDKETSVHIPFTYRPKLHFVSWVRRITGQLRFIIPPEIVDHVRYELRGRRGITDVNKVTWDVVSDVLHDLAKREETKYFSEYYQHVYQITNIIRGSPILKLNSEQEQELYNMFDIIYEMWEDYKQSDRSNFMSNALALQLCFYILGYPDYTISMFNMLKGSDNLRIYDRICEKICIDLGKEPIKTSTISNMKCGIKTGNIMKQVKSLKDEKPKVTSVTESNVMQLLKEKQEEEQNQKRKASDDLEEYSKRVKVEAPVETESKKRKVSDDTLEDDREIKKEKLDDAEDEWEWVEEEVEIEVEETVSESLKRKSDVVENETSAKKAKMDDDCLFLLDD